MRIELFRPLHNLLTRYMGRAGLMAFANTQALCTSFKSEVMLGLHQLGAVTLVSRTSLTAPTIDVIKAALFLASASLGAATATYSATGEVTGTNYTAGGITVTNATAPTNSGTTGYWTPSASFAWTTVTLATPFDAVQVYNSTQGNRSISIHTFGSQTVSAGNFTLTMPANAAATALVRIA